MYRFREVPEEGTLVIRVGPLQVRPHLTSRCTVGPLIKQVPAYERGKRIAPLLIRVAKSCARTSQSWRSEEP